MPKKTQSKTKTKKNFWQKFIADHSLLAFFGLLAVLLVLLGVSRYYKAQKQKQAVKPPKNIAKEAEVYQVGSFPYVKVQAQVDKAGVITVVAQTGGVVQKIYVPEGKQVKKGQTLVRLSTNYQGGSAQSISRQLAQKQYENFEASYQDQKQALAKQKEIAQLSDENSQELADISRQSAIGTEDLVHLNKEILDQLEKAIEADPNNLTLKTSRAQIKAAYENANAQLRQLKHQADETKPPAEIPQAKKEATLAQLAVQEKALDLQKDVLKLQLDLARIQESLLYPAAPFAGRVEQVFVKPGQMVSPGTPIATIVGQTNDITATAYVSKNIAKNVSTTTASEIEVGDETIKVLPTFVSNEATRGVLYSILYDIPAEYGQLLGNKEYVMVKVPLGYTSNLTQGEGVYVPIDAIHNTQSGSFLLVVGPNCQTESKQVEVGPLYGQFAYVYGDVVEGEPVVLSRNVVAGDRIKSEVLGCN